MGESGDPVGTADLVCRFIKPKHWNDVLKELSPFAFTSSRNKRPTGKAGEIENRNELSINHVGEVQALGSKLRDLCIDALEGYGEAHLEAGDFVTAAETSDSKVLAPVVVYRPELAGSAWRQWASAHAHVESSRPASGFPEDYLVALVQRVRFTRPPDEYAD